LSVLQTPHYGDRSALGIIEERARTNPDAIAFLQPGHEPLSFSELFKLARKTEVALEAAGIPQGTAIAVSLSDSARVVMAQLAMFDKWACAPLNPALTGAEHRTSFSHLKPAALLAEESSTAAIDAADAAGIRILTTSGHSSAGAFDVTVLSTGSAELDPSPWPGASLIFHTSGTTGQPKLVALTAANCLVRASEYIRRTGLTAADRLLSMSPAFLHQGWISVFAQILAGGSVVFTNGFAAEHFENWLDEHQPTWYGVAPAVHRAILASLKNQKPRTPLRFVRSSGAALTSDLLESLERVLGVAVIEGYGLTETGSIASTPLAPAKRKQGSAGTSAGIEISIRDQEGVPLSSGQTGEITVRGPAVAIPDGEWFSTGDLGYLDEDGYLFVTGRLSERVNRGGEKIMPLEVDAVLASHPAVEEAAAFGFPHPSLGEDLGAAVVLKPGATANERELRDFAALQLAAFKVPRRIIFLERLPRNVSGKPKRNELRNLIAPAPVLEEAAVDPNVPQRLREIWQRVLNRRDFGEHDNFFHLGGDSLRLAALLSEAGLGATSEFLAEPTLASLAKSCTDGSAVKHVIPMRCSGSRIPVFLIPPAEDDPLCFRHFAGCLGDQQPVYVVNTAAMPGERTMGSVEASATRAREAIRRVRPAGPYIIGGHCYGGVVAFETARQLAAEDRSVALVVLFDTPAPGYPKVLRHWRSYFAGLGSYTGGMARFPREAFAHLRHIVRLGRRKASISSNMSPAIRSFVADPVAVGQPCSYQIRPIDVPVVQFLATGVEDARLSWSSFAKAGFDPRRVPGGHASMLAPPHSAELAAQLSQVLSAWND
jgi:acyl-CoA synthetase (AMP-forming)/AMP-acid ligase II/thioesterase domain-containing protein